MHLRDAFQIKELYSEEELSYCSNLSNVGLNVFKQAHYCMKIWAYVVQKVKPEDHKSLLDNISEW